MPSKAEIRACPDLIADLAVEPTASMSDFLARLPADSDDVDIDIITVLLEQQDYINQCRQKVIDDIVARNGGDACGLELSRGGDRADLACVFPEPRYNGGYRLSFYDSHGPQSHMREASPEEALRDAIYMGYRTLIPGELDRLTETSTWQRGLAMVTDLMRQLMSSSTSKAH